MIDYKDVNEGGRVLAEYKDVVECAKAHPHIEALIDWCQLPNDPHLLAVLCKTDSDLTRFVCWFFNKETGGFGEGMYCVGIVEATLLYHLRAMRYGGLPRGAEHQNEKVLARLLDCFRTGVVR